jgi:hypothetical protein
MASAVSAELSHAAYHRPIHGGHDPTPVKQPSQKTQHIITQVPRSLRALSTILSSIVLLRLPARPTLCSISLSKACPLRRASLLPNHIRNRQSLRISLQLSLWSSRKAPLRPHHLIILPLKITLSNRTPSNSPRHNLSLPRTRPLLKIRTKTNPRSSLRNTLFQRTRREQIAQPPLGQTTTKRYKIVSQSALNLSLLLLSLTPQESQTALPRSHLIFVKSRTSAAQLLRDVSHHPISTCLLPTVPPRPSCRLKLQNRRLPRLQVKNGNQLLRLPRSRPNPLRLCPTSSTKARLRPLLVSDR